jgi:FRG domain
MIWSKSVIQITNLAGFVAAVQGVVKDWTPKGVDWYPQLWFRGHGRASWPLEPGWYRYPNAKGAGDEYYTESTLLENFRLRAPTYLDRLPTSDWEWLFLMQHYGLPTRLLDWTGIAPLNVEIGEAALPALSR